jgi:hypothetical protein
MARKITYCCKKFDINNNLGTSNRIRDRKNQILRLKMAKSLKSTEIFKSSLVEVKS